MNRLLIKKLITSIIFIALLFFLSIQNIKTSYLPVKNQIDIIKENYMASENTTILSKLNFFNSAVKTIESTINENTYERYKFIEAYGYLQKVMDKNEESNFEVVKDKSGILHYTYFENKPKDVSSLALKTKNFKNNISDKNVKVIYLMPPDKYIKGKTKMERGIPYNYANETADNYLNALGNEDIDYIDLRENIIASGKEPVDLFYKTDHHWKVETAFDQYCELTKILKSEYGFNFNEDKNKSYEGKFYEEKSYDEKSYDEKSYDEVYEDKSYENKSYEDEVYEDKSYEIKFHDDKFYTDKNNYNYIRYKNIFIGSMGRKCGKYYDGVDDFTLIYPKFETSYSFYSRTKDYVINSEGRFEDVLLLTHNINYNGGEYDLGGDKYSTYLMGNQGEVHITNNKKLEGPKVLFIKDSFAVPLAAFFSNLCSDTYLIDPRYYDGDILEFANSKDLDIIFISFNPQDINDDFFKF